MTNSGGLESDVLSRLLLLVVELSAGPPMINSIAPALSSVATIFGLLLSWCCDFA